MQDSDFHEVMDDIFMDIEDRVDQQDEDIDVENSGGVLTLTFEDGSQVILSRQVAAQEIWIAAKSGGFHLRQQDNTWTCSTTGETLEQLVDRVAGEQGGVSLFS